MLLLVLFLLHFNEVVEVLPFAEIVALLVRQVKKLLGHGEPEQESLGRVGFTVHRADSFQLLVNLAGRARHEHLGAVEMVPKSIEAECLARLVPVALEYLVLTCYVARVLLVRVQRGRHGGQVGRTEHLLHDLQVRGKAPSRLLHILQKNTGAVPTHVVLNLVLSLVFLVV